MLGKSTTYPFITTYCTTLFYQGTILRDNFHHSSVLTSYFCNLTIFKNMSKKDGWQIDGKPVIPLKIALHP